MKFGPVPPRQAEGATAVHTIRQGSLVLKKGTLVGPAEVAALEAAGIKDIVVARLEPGDVSEDKAAAEIAKAVAGQGVHVDRAFTGRANLFAEKAGVLVVDKEAIDRLNRVDEAITFATLPAFKPVVEGEMIATVKIIPFAVGQAALDASLAVAGKPFIRVAPYKIKKVGVVSTLLPGLATKVVEKTLRVTEERLDAGRRHASSPSAACRTSRRARGQGGRRGAEGGRRAGGGVRRLRHRRPARRHPGRGRGGRRHDRAFRHAGRSRQPDADRAGEGPADARRAGLRALAQGKRLRLDPDAAARRPAGVARGRHRPGRRRPADGDRDAAAAARRAGAREGPPDRRGRAGRRPLDPHGRAEQAARRDRRQAAGAHRRRAGAGVARAAGDRGDRASARQGRGGAGGARRAVRAQSEFRRRAFDLGEGRPRGAAGGGRRRHRLPRRHAAGDGGADRQADRRRSIPRRARWW